MRQWIRKIILLQRQMHCLVMQVILAQMMKRIKKKKEKGNGIVGQAEVEVKVVAEVEVGVEAEVTVAVGLKAVGKVRAIELLSKM